MVYSKYINRKNTPIEQILNSNRKHTPIGQILNSKDVEARETFTTFENFTEKNLL